MHPLHTPVDDYVCCVFTAEQIFHFGEKLAGKSYILNLKIWVASDSFEVQRKSSKTKW